MRNVASPEVERRAEGATTTTVRRDAGPKRRLSLRLSVTDRCELRCWYCVSARGYAKAAASEVLTFEQIAAFVRALTRSFKVEKIHLTGGEPLLRRDVVTLVRMLAATGVRDLALTTNGQRLARLAPALAAAGLKRVNVSLDTLNAETYRRLTLGGELRKTLAGIAAARACGLGPIKTNAVILKGINESEVTTLASWAIAHGYEPRFIELMPIGPAASHFAQRFVPAANILSTLEKVFHLTPVEGVEGMAKASARRYRAVAGDHAGTVGIISSVTAPFCQGCPRLRLTATGDLVGCLGRAEAVNVRGYLDGSPAGEGALLAAVRAALGVKSKRHTFALPRAMVHVGG